MYLKQREKKTFYFSLLNVCSFKQMFLWFSESMLTQLYNLKKLNYGSHMKSGLFYLKIKVKNLDLKSFFCLKKE